MSPNIMFETGQFATILAMISAAMGVSAVPAMAVKPHPGCKFIPISDKHSTRTVGLVTARHHHKTRAQQLLVAHVMMTQARASLSSATRTKSRRARSEKLLVSDREGAGKAPVRG